MERQCPIDPAVSALFGPFLHPSLRFAFIAPWNAAAIQREDAKAQRRKELILTGAWMDRLNIHRVTSVLLYSVSSAVNSGCLAL